MPGVTVLIVDDHAGFRDTARLLLEVGGWHVVGEAADGAQAIAAIRDVRPQVVLLDVNLPDLDGFEVTRRVLAGGARHPAVVLTSSRDDAGYASVAERSGARGFVPKSELSVSLLERMVGG